MNEESEANISKIQQKIKAAIAKVKQEILESKGFHTEEAFEKRLYTVCINCKQVKEISDELKESISLATHGIDPELKIRLDDKNLTKDVFIQVMHKIYASIRFEIYRGLNKVRDEKMQNVGKTGSFISGTKKQQQQSSIHAITAESPSKDESLIENIKSPNLKGSLISNKDVSLLQDTVPMDSKGLAISTQELQRVVKHVDIDKIR